MFCVAQQLAELQLALALPPARGGDACVCLALQTWACVVAGVLALAVGGWPLAFALIACAKRGEWHADALSGAARVNVHTCTHRILLNSRARQGHGPHAHKHTHTPSPGLLSIGTVIFARPWELDGVMDQLGRVLCAEGGEVVLGYAAQMGVLLDSTLATARRISERQGGQYPAVQAFLACQYSEEARVRHGEDVMGKCFCDQIMLLPGVLVSPRVPDGGHGKGAALLQGDML